MSKFKKLGDDLTGAAVGSLGTIIKDEVNGAEVFVPVNMENRRDKTGKIKSYHLNRSDTEVVEGIGEVWQLYGKGCLLRTDDRLHYIDGAKISDF